MALDLTYPNITRAFDKYLAGTRTESRAFVAWFLEHFYRLDVDEAQDAVCDGHDDKGVDGIYIDHTFETIDIFQAKLYQNSSKSLGDTALKEFIGTLSQFKDAVSIARIEATTSNKDLKALIKDLDLSGLLRKGWRVRGVFLTNAAKDNNAESYQAAHPTDLVVWDQTRLAASFVDTSPPALQQRSVSLDISGFDAVHYKTPDAEAYIAPIKAADLLKLHGLRNGSLFAWNVRQTLGKTKVNKEIAESISKPKEHKNFLLYHNGLTILCETISMTADKITINGYNVVNGCQSLTTLAENEQQVTDELRLITRLVALKPDSALASEITRRSNNQNSINARDLQSNSVSQRRLQTEIKNATNGAVFYEIKRGEIPSGKPIVLSNEDAARLLLAFDLDEPWSCHQSYKLFDDLHAQIFGRPEVTGERILALRSVHAAVLVAIGKINDPLVRGYRLTQSFLLYLLKRALLLDTVGANFVKRPDVFFKDTDGDARIQVCVQAVLQDLIVDINAELKDRADKGVPFDYKRELKSPTAVKALALQIIPLYEKALQRNRVASFSVEWGASNEHGQPVRPGSRTGDGH